MFQLPLFKPEVDTTDKPLNRVTVTLREAGCSVPRINDNNQSTFRKRRVTRASKQAKHPTTHETETTHFKLAEDDIVLRFTSWRRKTFGGHHAD